MCTLLMRSRPAGKATANSPGTVGAQRRPAPGFDRNVHVCSGAGDHQEVVALSTPTERSLHARLAAHALHAQYDSRDITANARKSFLAKFEDEVDPARELPEAERLRRAEHARKAYFVRLAYMSAKARRERAEGADR